MCGAVGKHDRVVACWEALPQDLQAHATMVLETLVPATAKAAYSYSPTSAQLSPQLATRTPAVLAPRRRVQRLPRQAARASVSSAFPQWDDLGRGQQSTI